MRLAVPRAHRGDCPGGDRGDGDTGRRRSGADRTVSTSMQWTPVTTHGGGWVTGLVTSPSGAMYSRTDVGGAYRWNATRNSWEQMLTAAGVPAPNPERLRRREPGCGRSRRSDRVRSGRGGSGFGSRPGAPQQRRWSNTSWDRGLFRHPTPESGGATLPYRRTFGSAWDVTASPTDPGFLVAVLDDHQDLSGRRHPDRRASAWSSDGSATWTRFAALAAGTAPGDMMFGNVAVSAHDSDNIVWTPSRLSPPKAYSTSDRGASWSAGVLHGAAAGDFLHPAHYLKRKTLTADPLSAGTIYALGGNDRTGDSAMWKSVDGGASWTRVNATNGPGRRADWDFRFNSRLIAVPGRSGHLLALPGMTDSGDHPYWRSTDGGRSWTERTLLRDAHDLGIGAPLVAGGSPTLFGYGKVGSVRGLYRSTDLGKSWTFLAAHPGGWYQGIAAVVGDPEVPGRVYVGLSGEGVVQGRPSGAPALATPPVVRAAPAPAPPSARRVTAPAAASAGVRLAGVRPDAVRTPVRRGTSPTVVGVVAPGTAGRPVVLQVKAPTGWRTVARAVSVRGGAVRVPYRAPSVRGTTTMRLATVASRSAMPSASVAFTVRTV